MQFPVPQFTDVEDKIIGALSFKQFGIIFGAGVVVFLFYSATKSIAVMIAAAILVGLPALALAFGKLNGRPMYKSIAFFTKFLTSPKVLVFHKEASNNMSSADFKDAEMKKTAVNAAGTAVVDPQTRLKEINRLLKQKEEEEKELLKSIN